MNRIFFLITVFLISFSIYGFYISQFEFDFIQNKKPTENVNLFYDYKVGLGVFTQLSIGSGQLLSIAEEAKRARLNYVFISDINAYYSLPVDQNISGIGILNAIKEKSNTKNQFVYKLNQKDFSTSEGKTLSTDASTLIISTNPISQSYNLNELIEQSIDGVEVVNFKKIVQNSWLNSKLSTIWSILYYSFNPRLALIRLFHEPNDEIKIFDQLSQKKRVVFFMGAEATAKAIPFADWLVKIPSYESSFSIASQHLLLTSELSGDLELDKIKITQALKNGNSYVGFDALGDTNGFEIYMTQLKQKYFNSDQIHWGKKLKIFYKLPAEPSVFYEVILFKNGVRFDHLNTFTGEFIIPEPGVYRVQVRLSPRLPLPDAIKWITWIYSNNFYVEKNNPG